jgi:hypothetical protein
MIHDPPDQLAGFIVPAPSPVGLAMELLDEAVRQIEE